MSTSGEKPSEDVFDRFTDATKKRKRKEKKTNESQKKRAKIVNTGKKFAKSEFNVVPTPEDVELWEAFVVQPVPDQKWLETRLREAKITDVGYQQLPKTHGIFCVYDFLSAAGHCTEWLDMQLHRMGWRRNMTGYVPVTVCHSTNELLDATLECYKMAIKQMLRLQEFQTATNSDGSKSHSSSK